SAAKRCPPAAATAPLSVSPRVTGYEPGLSTHPSTRTLPAGRSVITSPARAGGFSAVGSPPRSLAGASTSLRIGAPPPGSPAPGNSTTRPASLFGPPAPQTRSATVAPRPVGG